ncbi:MAG: DUF4956 domain-containing protein [Alistipes sp.]|nr:DUF4956 domain-containing protein [Alistipes sp.]
MVDSELSGFPTGGDPEMIAMQRMNENIFDLSRFELSPSVELCIQFLFNIVMCSVLIWLFYYPKGRRKEFATTFMLFSAAVFLLLHFMGGVSLDITVGLGLFMIFGIMRYRTEMVPIREMTYLFLTIALSVVNGINNLDDKLILANALLIILLLVVEYVVVRRREASRLVCYERIELIQPERRKELIADLEKRLGHKVLRVEIGSVDFLRDVAFLKVYYRPQQGDCSTTDPTMKINEKSAFNS